MNPISCPNFSVALVQGASRGIGLAFCEALLEARPEARIVACARAPERSQGLGELRSHYGDRLSLMALDVTEEEQVANLADKLRQAAMAPSLVLNVSGLLHDGAALQPEKRIEDIDWDSMQRVFAVNTLGPALMLKHFLPIMPRDQHGLFAFLSARVGSIADNRLGGWYSYRASKAALNQLVKTASIEARRRFKQVSLVALHPGTTDTGLSRPFQANVPAEKLFSTRYTVEQLLSVLARIKPDETGVFRAWDGQEIPW